MDFVRECGANPLFWLLAGGMVAVTACYYFLSVFNLPFFICFFLFALIAGLCLLMGGRGLKVALVLVGVGGFGFYSSYLLTGQLLFRHALCNQTFHARGVFSPPSRFLITEVDGHPGRGKMYLRGVKELVFIEGEELNLSVTGRFDFPYQNPGFAKYLRSRNFAGVLDVSAVHSFKPPEERQSSFTVKLRDKLDKFFKEQAAVYPRSAAYLRALVNADKEGMSRRLLSFFRRLGISHFFVISGLHVGFFCALVIFPINFASSKLKFIVLSLFLFLYLSFLNWPVSALRAGLMIWLYFLARALNRRCNFFSVFISAVFLLMLFDPFVILDAGFQLTVAAVSGIYFASPYSRIVSGKPLKMFVYNLGAYFGVLSIVVYHFGYIPRYGFIFSYIGGLLFPLFLIVLAAQSFFLATGWSFFALHVEGIFFHLENLLENMLVMIEPLIVTGPVSPFVVGLLAVCLILLFVRRIPAWLKITGFCGVLAVLFFLMQPLYEPHFEVKNNNGNYIFHLHEKEADYVFIPRRTRLEGYDWYLLEKYLREKGVYRTRVLVSEYNQASAAYFDPQLIVEEHWTYWQETGRKNKAELSYDFENHMLETGWGKVVFDNPDFVGEEYYPDILTAVINQKTAILGKIDRLSEKSFKALQNSDLKLIVLREGETYRIR